MLNKVARLGLLKRAFLHIERRTPDKTRGAGVDGVTVADFETNLNLNLDKLSEELKGRTYSPDPLKRVHLEDRDLAVPTVRDRVAQNAIRMLIEPEIDKTFQDCVHGFRPGRGYLTAIPRITELIEAGKNLVFETDIAKCFPSIPHEPLLEKFKVRVPDQDIISMVTAMIKSPVRHGNVEKESLTGLHQGDPLSPLLCNIYLNDFDKEMMKAGFSMIRYADDIVVLADKCNELYRAYKLTEDYLGSAGLSMKLKKTSAQRASYKFSFIGYDIKLQNWGVRLTVSEKSLAKLDTNITKLLTKNIWEDPKIVADKIYTFLTSWVGHFGCVNVTYHLEEIDKRILKMIRTKRKDVAKFGIPKTGNLITELWEKRERRLLGQQEDTSLYIPPDDDSFDFSVYAEDYDFD